MGQAERKGRIPQDLCMRFESQTLFLQQIVNQDPTYTIPNMEIGII